MGDARHGGPGIAQVIAASGIGVVMTDISDYTYQATKTLTEKLEKTPVELGPKKIRVYAISPGPLKTRAASGLNQDSCHVGSYAF